MIKSIVIRTGENMWIKPVFSKEILTLMKVTETTDNAEESRKEFAQANTGKKRKRLGKMSDVINRLNIQSHVVGEDCKYARLKCFQNIPETARNRIIQNFKLMASVTEQNMYLCGLISLRPVKQQRHRKPKEEASFHDVAYSYRVRYVDNNNETKEIGAIPTWNVIRILDLLINEPKEWADALRSSGSKSSPFDVEEVSQKYFRSWTQHFTSCHKQQCPFLSRPIRELKVVKEHSRHLFHRSTYNGAWKSTVIVNPNLNKQTILKTLNLNCRFIYIQSRLEYENLQDLTKFCEEDAGEYFRVLSHSD
ncbi:hypothetical protein ILUMI_16100 [Ignelater luminosus]|uniref:Uncharacterized protein n=1 Tax=Ignelater luminosus TaxID=2038154 RepID=A0A8K0CSW8_IGNLU|nr:hypothetical protein ILUMI_16100 [Ignelater luminosus]